MSIGKSVKLELQTEFPYEEVSEHPVLGVERVIGYVVKGTPFKVTIRVGSKVKVPLSNAKVEMTLITEETYTPVEIGERPICFVASASQNVITCETRLMVLSTQLSKSCVVIKITVTLPDNKTLEVLSCPIKVVSKPEQIRRKRKEANQDPELEGAKRRARSEDVLAGLHSIYSQAASTLNMLQQVDSDDSGMLVDETSYDDENTTDAGEPSSLADTMSDTSTLMDEEPQIKRQGDASIISTFEQLLSSFDQLNSADPYADLSAVPLDRLKHAFNFLGLPDALAESSADMEDYN